MNLLKINDMNSDLVDIHTGLIRCEDGHLRPPWAVANPQLREYYDTEWGLPVTGERAMFERMCLEGFQAGLSWSLILKRRESLRRAFKDFHPDELSSWTHDDVQAALEMEGMIRNQRKIASVVNNAKATIALRKNSEVDNMPLDELIWSYKPKHQTVYTHLSEVPSTCPEATALSKHLKKLGFSFVGPKTMFALFEATGIVDTHVAGAYRAVE